MINYFLQNKIWIKTNLIFSFIDTKMSKTNFLFYSFIFIYVTKRGSPSGSYNQFYNNDNNKQIERRNEQLIITGIEPLERAVAELRITALFVPCMMISVIVVAIRHVLEQMHFGAIEHVRHKVRMNGRVAPALVVESAFPIEIAEKVQVRLTSEE